ncbi:MULTISPECIES: PP2C family protein-serine/threonine phosphatase [Sorangium]|uniref:PP2C family protein-serine/threonine phosphatase n=1 Tax=Sorangium TaxID=39643 RepID=UPI0002DC50B3|nr:PP2C family serine/threonine-protein phosphatase [Sorangium cellulosum]
MADLAAALVMGIALLGLIYWYFRSNNGDRARPRAATALTQGGPGAQALDEGEGDLEDSTTRPGAAALRGGAPASESAHAKTAGGHGRTERVSSADWKRSNGPSRCDDDDAFDDDDDDLTLITLAPPEVLQSTIKRASIPSYGGDDDDDDDDDDGHEREEPSAVPIIYDDEAAVDEPTSSSPLLLISAVGQTDPGQKRKKNEDCYLCLDEHYLFAVADGMGGHAGGDVASRLAVDTIARAFKDQSFVDSDAESPYPDVPRRGSELAVAIQQANQAIYERAHAERSLTGMGTTLVSARFSPNKQRLYIGHVGDSRCYRLRDNELTQLTTDHTMGAAGITGPMANHLSRAIGISPAVKVDLIIARPHPGDVYLLCSDGLSKMTTHEAIRDILLAEPDPEKASQALIEKANAGGGRDNITVILVRVSDPKDLARLASRAGASAGASAG